MKTSAPGSRLTAILVAVTLVVSLFVATRAMGAPADIASISSQYAAWAGGKANADALVTGLRSGTAITLTTMSPDRIISIAGFTPRAPMAPQEIANALASARASLARMGIRRPNAEQIQAALIGGEVELPGGESTVVDGAVAASPGPPPGRVAATR